MASETRDVINDLVFLSGIENRLYLQLSNAFGYVNRHSVLDMFQNLVVAKSLEWKTAECYNFV